MSSRRSASKDRFRSPNGTTAEAVYQALRQRIVDGELTPGQRLRSDALATVFKVSRTPVREALRKLEAEGLIEHSPRGGLIVRELSEEDLTEIFYIREVLEGLASRLAAENATPSEISDLHILLEDMEAAAGRGELKTLRTLTGEFHELVTRAAHNRRLAQTLKALQDQVRQVQWSTLFLDGRAAAALKEHKSLISAIEARDGDRAENLARTHRRNTLALRRKMIRDRLRKTRAGEAESDTEAP
jgi:DNA-binding GntR family transcriptional regulator